MHCGTFLPQEFLKILSSSTQNSKEGKHQISQHLQLRDDFRFPSLLPFKNVSDVSSSLCFLQLSSPVKSVIPNFTNFISQVPKDI